MNDSEVVSFDRVLGRSNALITVLMVVACVASGWLSSESFTEGAFRCLVAATGISACVQIVAGVMLASGASPGRFVGYSALGQIARGCATFLFFVPLAVLPWDPGVIGSARAFPLFLVTFPMLCAGFVLEWRARRRERRESWLREHRLFGSPGDRT